MRSVVVTRYGGPGVLKVREAPDPVPAAGEVRVRVAFAGLNFSDVMARVGLYPDAPKAPCVLGYEVSGTVDALGEGVSSVSVGARVVSLTRFGGQSDVVCVPAGQALAMPEAMSLEEGAALPVVYVTAYHMVKYVAAVRPGAKVLVHMAAGGVGLAAIQLLKKIPEVVIFGTASASKHGVLREAGVHHPIDYRTKDYAAEVRELTQGRGVDVIFDALGGADWAKGYKLLAPAGHLVAFGFANAADGPSKNYFRLISQGLRIPMFTPMKLMNDNKSVSGVNVGHLWSEAALMRSELLDLMKLYADGTIKPTIDGVYPFEKAAEAHERIEKRLNVGKVLLTP